MVECIYDVYDETYSELLCLRFPMGSFLMGSQVWANRGMEIDQMHPRMLPGRTFSF